MKIEEFIQPFLSASLVTFLFIMIFFKIPPENGEYVKMCLTSLISFISGSSLALAIVRGAKDDTTVIKTPTASATNTSKDKS